eukprot:12813652-Heterocapsa_arctica.AAC.1
MCTCSQARVQANKGRRIGFSNESPTAPSRRVAFETPVRLERRAAEPGTTRALQAHGIQSVRIPTGES